MEEKKNNKIKLSTYIIVLVLLVATVLGGFIYIQKMNANKKLEELKNEEANLKNTVSELQGKLDGIDNIANSTNIGDYFILYNGCEMPKKTGHVNFGFMDGLNKTKYNINYYNYEKGKFTGESKGNLIDSGIENCSVVDNVKKIATSKKYNAIPREFKEIEKLPNELIDMADCTTVDIHSVDLDGDGKEEKIVCSTVNYKKGVAIGDGEPEASSEIMLFDSNYKKIANLVTLENGFWGNIKEEDKKVFLSLDKVEYFDIDNDGIMEILIDIPTYEQEGGADLSILKYNKGKLEGDTNIKASVQP